MTITRSVFGGGLASVFVASIVTVAAGVAADDKAGTAAVPTFTKDILPIVQKSCQNCHRPGQMAPFSLMSYETARPWVRSIKEKVVSRYMPPWHIDRTIGEYSPDPSLSDEEIATIARWADGGAPKGDPKDAPPPRVFPADNAWVFGEEPDLVVTSPPMNVAAGGADWYPEPESPSGLTEDRYIKWMQVVPEYPKVLHHIMIYTNQAESAAGAVLGDAGRSGSGNARRTASGQQSSLLILFAGGGPSGVSFPEGQGKLLQAGSTFRWANHFHSNGEAVTEHTKIAFKFFPKGYQPDHLISTRAIGTANTLSIPPGEPNARADGYFTLVQPARIVSFQPHMHFRGKRMMLEAIPPSGQPVMLTDVNHYRWTWQLTYRYKNPPVFPAGTMLHMTSFHDNSAANRDNPDPTAFVSWGDRTIDEMNNGWVDFYYISDKEYADLQKAQLRSATTNQQQ